MKTKICIKCENEKAIALFYKKNICKSCQKEYNKQYYQNNKIKLNDKSKEYHKNNKVRKNLVLAS